MRRNLQRDSAALEELCEKRFVFRRREISKLIPMDRLLALSV